MGKKLKSKTLHKPKHCECDICGQVFKFQWNLKTHVESFHRKIFHFQCENCSMRFHKSFVTTYRNHLKSCAKDGIKSFKCEFCHLRFKNSVPLARHQTRSHGIAPPDDLFQCDDCGKNFKSNRGLRVHVESAHLKIFHFECEKCGQKFHKNYINGYKRHVKKCLEGKDRKSKKPDDVEENNGESGFKKFWCEICDERFRTRKQIFHHKRQNHPDRKKPDIFECKVCLKVFKTLQNFKLHNEEFHLEITHLDCPTCDRKYHKSRKFGYDRHVRACARNGPKNVKCTLCDRKFLHENGRSRHVKRWHPGELVNETEEEKHESNPDVTVEDSELFIPDLVESPESSPKGDTIASDEQVTEELEGEETWLFREVTDMLSNNLNLVKEIEQTVMLFRREAGEDHHESLLPMDNEKSEFIGPDQNQNISLSEDSLTVEVVNPTDTESGLQCQVCSRLFDNKELLKKHLVFDHIMRDT